MSTKEKTLTMNFRIGFWTAVLWGACLILRIIDIKLPLVILALTVLVSLASLGAGVAAVNSKFWSREWSALVDGLLKGILVVVLSLFATFIVNIVFLYT